MAGTQERIIEDLANHFVVHPTGHRRQKRRSLGNDEERVSYRKRPRALGAQEVHASGDRHGVDRRGHWCTRAALEPLLDRAEVVRASADGEEIEIAVMTDVVFDIYVLLDDRYVHLVKTDVHAHRFAGRPLVWVRAVERCLGSRGEARVAGVEARSREPLSLGFHALNLRTHKLGEIGTLGVDDARTHALDASTALDICDDTAGLCTAHHRHLYHAFEHVECLLACVPHARDDDDAKVTAQKPSAAFESLPLPAEHVGVHRLDKRDGRRGLHRVRRVAVIPYEEKYE